MDKFAIDRSLHQAYVRACRARDAALAEAEHWRQLYQVEAKQRRAEAEIAQQQIQLLQTELTQLRQTHQALPATNRASSSISQPGHLSSKLTPDTRKWQQQLAQLQLECDRLRQALQQEQANHARTRESLTGALGDAIALVKKYRP